MERNKAKGQTGSRKQRTLQATLEIPTFTSQQWSVTENLPQIMTWSHVCCRKTALREIQKLGWKGKAQQHHCFLLWDTYFNKGEWLYVLFKSHMLNCQVKTTKSWLYTKDLWKYNTQDYWKEFKVTSFFLKNHSYLLHLASHKVFCCHKPSTLISPPQT